MPSSELSRTSLVYRRIRDAILAGGLPPGTPLSRRRLAKQFSVSTLPVAEALQRLLAEGLVESRARAGTRVRIPAPEEVHGHYLVREALETQAARLFAEGATARQRAALLKTARDLDDAYAALNSNGYSRRRHGIAEKKHFAFHMQIARATGCPQLVEAIERSRVLLLNWLFMTAGDYIVLPPLWHRELAEALASADAEKAERAMRRHVRYRREDVEARFARMLAIGAGTGRIVRGPRVPKKS